ncbi:hypothetical protein GPUN_2186 [Glaciecola punicea ACAM 611]|uniref:Uncharacterized protein n=1 Tax=Glaciecola punicea ACAM 611 TaxID=1121923 RepID=H5TDC4_9ALTE|nr:hypothetical protein GPUN_2186 [Glaciecola punicea ACAM 611]
MDIAGNEPLINDEAIDSENISASPMKNGLTEGLVILMVMRAITN